MRSERLCVLPEILGDIRRQHRMPIEAALPTLPPLMATPWPRHMSGAFSCHPRLTARLVGRDQRRTTTFVPTETLL